MGAPAQHSEWRVYPSLSTPADLHYSYCPGERGAGPSRCRPSPYPVTRNTARTCIGLVRLVVARERRECLHPHIAVRTSRSASCARGPGAARRASPSVAYALAHVKSTRKACWHDRGIAREHRAHQSCCARLRAILASLTRRAGWYAAGGAQAPAGGGRTVASGRQPFSQLDRESGLGFGSEGHPWYRR